MQKLNDISRIVTARINVPVNTPSKNPVVKTFTSPLPMLLNFSVFAYSAAGAVAEIETGWKLKSGGIDIIPSMGSYDDLTNETFAPVMSGFPFESGEINHQLPGSPYQFEMEFYNIDGAVPVYYFIVARVGPKIELPLALIQNDEKKTE